MSKSDIKIVLVGAAGMSFGPVMVHDAVHSDKIRGCELVMMDIDQKHLDDCFAAAERLNTAAGNPIRLSKSTVIAEALDGADFVLMSVEKSRFKFWKQDYEIPVLHGSTQIMGENGGPGGLFHSLRSINLTLEICRDIEKYAPDAFVINLTNPMSRVCLAISRATKLRHVGLCHEISGGHARVAAYLLKQLDKVHVEASGINHFTFFYKLEDKETGEDLYPKMEKHLKMFPFLYPPLLRFMFKEYGLLATSTDSHIGEYVPFAKDIVKQHMSFNSFFHREWQVRNALTVAYGKGQLPLPLHKLPRSTEIAFPLIEGLATGDRTYLPAVNVPNKGYIPNLPDGSIVEVHAYTGEKDLEPQVVPPMEDRLAGIMRLQIRIQDLVVDAALNKSPETAYEALLLDPLSPVDRDACRRLFDQMYNMQKEHLPF